MKRPALLLSLLALGALGLVACGGDDDDDGGETTAAETTATETTGGGGGDATTLDVSAPADGSLSFDQAFLAAKPGSVTINFDNPASVSHDVTVEDSTGNEIGGTDLVSQGTATVTLDLLGGTYTFFCSVPGHREGGMEGPLTVAAGG